jgi:hypothetical protein
MPQYAPRKAQISQIRMGERMSTPMSIKWSDWNRLAIAMAVIFLVVIGITSVAAKGAEARTTLQASYALSPNNVCRVLSPENASSYISSKFAEMTGQAVSPLLSLTTIGWFRNLCTEEQHRHLLPWYYQSGFLALTLVIVLCLAFKDTLLAPLGPFKKPLDALGEFIHTASGVVVLPISIIYFADSVANPIAGHLAAMATWLLPPAYASDGSSLLIAMPQVFMPLGSALGVSLGLIIFSSNWILGNIVEVLIFLSPIPFLDTFLSGTRSFLIGLILLLAYVNPLLAGGVALLILIISLWAFGWSFRLLTVGLVYSSDILRFKWRRFQVEQQGILAFSGQINSRTDSRTTSSMKSGLLGHLNREDQNWITFAYYPYLILPRQQVRISVEHTESDEVAVTRTFLAPTITKIDSFSGKSTPLFRLPPRYRNHEHAIANYLGLAWQQKTSPQKGSGLFGWLSTIMG